MVLYLKKWYFDVISEDNLGYYFIAVLSLGGVRFGASAIYHFNRSSITKSFKFGRLRKASDGELLLSNAGMEGLTEKIDLFIEHSSCGIRGQWDAIADPVIPQNKPIYEDKGFRCEWEIPMPFAAVAIEFHDGESTRALKGTGYVDQVKMSIPLWYMPLEKLYWGRLHRKDSWIVLFALDTLKGEIAFSIDPCKVETNVTVETDCNSDNRIEAFCWKVGLERQEIQAETVRALENQEILRRGVLARILPKRWLEISGTDSKYEIRSLIMGDEYHGIMEEVIWNG